MAGSSPRAQVYSQRFRDAKPINFGRASPRDHAVHGVVGWVSAQRSLTLESGELYEITGLVVSASQRQQGIGKRLVQAAQAWADAQGATTMRVRSNIRRAESHPFYQSLGYMLDKTQHVYSKPLHPRPVPPKR